MAFIPRRRPERISARTSEEALKRAWELGCAGTAFDAGGMLRRMGCTVEAMDLGNASGVLERSGDSWICRTNSLQNARRQNFALAVQLAHVLLHADLLPDGPHEEHPVLRHSGMKGLEAEALEFACALLVPERELELQVRQGRSRLTELADWFNVPLDVMRWRAWSLGLISAF